MRGEDRFAYIGCTVEMETPPLARGRLFAPGKIAANSRNTPACAGKTSRARRRSRLRWKHPRLRGEDPASSRVQEAGRETPPLARGRHLRAIASAHPWGNTPACAGKTRPEKFDERVRQKHPRLRGEDFTAGITPRISVETPPLARGRPDISGYGPNDMRNTPACAGKT